MKININYSAFPLLLIGFLHPASARLTGNSRVLQYKPKGDPCDPGYSANYQECQSNICNSNVYRCDDVEQVSIDGDQTFIGLTHAMCVEDADCLSEYCKKDQNYCADFQYGNPSYSAYDCGICAFNTPASTPAPTPSPTIPQHTPGLEFDLNIASDVHKLMYYASLGAKISVASYFSTPEDEDKVFDFYEYEKIEKSEAAMKWKELAVVAKHKHSDYGETCVVGFSGAFDNWDMGVWYEATAGFVPGWRQHTDDEYTGTLNSCSVHPPALTTTNDMFMEHANVAGLLVDCYNTCEDPDCKLVIAGHSAGGAEAALAPMFMAALIGGQVPRHWIDNPTVVTFGSFSPVTDNDCLQHNLDHHFAFYRARNGAADTMGFKFTHGDKSGFQQLVIGDSVHDMKWYPRTGNYLSWPADLLASDIFAATVHDVGFYYDDIGDATDAGEDFTAFNVNAFPVDHWCYETASLCASNTCLNFFCT
jgi:hypothetical protein